MSKASDLQTKRDDVARKIRQNMTEDLHAIRRNRVGGVHTLALKNLSKVGQFLVRPRRSS